MIITIDPARATLRQYADSPARFEVELDRLANELQAGGVELLSDPLPEGQIRISLRNLLPYQGSVIKAKQFLAETLQRLGCEMVSYEAQDLSYLGGQGDVFMHAASRGLESRIPGVTNILSNITADEDGLVDLFTPLDKAAIWVAGDSVPEGKDPEILRRGAAMDLVHNGLLQPNDVNEHYRDFMEANNEQYTAAPLPPEFETSPRPYQSPFDHSELTPEQEFLRSHGQRY